MVSSHGLPMEILCIKRNAARQPTLAMKNGHD
jgi:hypothetical protein